MKVLRVIYPDYYPMNNFNCSVASSYKYCQMPGLAVEIIRCIAKTMNATLETVHYDRNFTVDDVFEEPNERFVGMYAQIQNGEADLLAYPVEATQHRRDYWDFTHPLYKSETHIAFKMEDTTLSSVFDFFRVYGGFTWLFMALTFVAFTTFGVLVRLVEKRFNLCYSLNVFSHIWKYFRLQILQAVDIKYRLRSGNVSLVFFSLFQCAVVLSLYQSYILTSVVRMRTPPQFTFEDIKQLLLDERFQLVTARPTAWYFEQIEESRVEPFFSLRQALRQRRPAVVATDVEALQWATSGDYMLFVQSDRHDRYLVHEFCDLTTVQSPFPPQEETFLMRKGHPLFAEINRAIDIERQQIARLYRKYISYRPPTACPPTKRNIKPLTLTPYIGILLLLIFGFICAGFFFIVELVFGFGDSSGHERALIVKTWQ
ncbi:hypothetical protein M3Y99_00666900 [Aphelenchoides fujianensis]|nr:hypothetical protein M3Y99_00666900 [Aphelenchoides fujianensis]